MNILSESELIEISKRIEKYLKLSEITHATTKHLLNQAIEELERYSCLGEEEIKKIKSYLVVDENEESPPPIDF